jgi:ankyrin repeat protein
MLLFSGCTSLHWAAGSGQMEVISYLVRDRLVSVDIRATKKARGRTPLHYACRNGCLETAKLLVELGADVDARAKHDVSPFQLAVWQNHMDVCRWLVRVLHDVSFCSFYTS